jgi:hypothetical protein
MGPLAKQAKAFAAQIEKAEEAHLAEVVDFLKNQDHASKLIAERAGELADSRETNRRLRLDLEAGEAARKDLLGRQERNRARADLVRAFLAQAEKCQFTDPEGHKIEMNRTFAEMAEAFTDTPPKTVVPLGLAIKASQRAEKRHGA